MKLIPDRRALPAGLRISEWRAGDGWPIRRFDWPSETGARGSILFQTGRGDFIEKYLETYAHFHDRGWNVGGFDWRGQGGSGRIAGDPAFDALLDDADRFAARWLAEMPGPHVLIGHSMGGHLALRLIAERGARFDAAILVAPMLGLNTGALPAAVARGLAALLSAIGLARRPAWREGSRPGEAGSMRQANLTACRERYADELWWKARHPELALPIPSWGWLRAAFASIGALGGQGALERVDMPILILASERDRLVSIAAIREAAARLPDARLVTSAEGAHELLREIDAIRRPLLAEIDRFLDERAPRR